MRQINAQIDLAYQADFDVKRVKRLIEVAVSALEFCRVDDGEATIVIASDEALRSLNRQYRGVDAPTDVLSFEAAYSEDECAGEGADSFPATGDFASPEEERPYLGDVIISAPRAIRQAQVGGHSALEETLLLTVHGMLHLLGFDHLTPTEKERMWRVQGQILRLNKLSHVQPTEV